MEKHDYHALWTSFISSCKPQPTVEQLLELYVSVPYMQPDIGGYFKTELTAAAENHQERYSLDELLRIICMVVNEEVADLVFQQENGEYFSQQQLVEMTIHAQSLRIALRTLEVFQQRWISELQAVAYPTKQPQTSQDASLHIQQVYGVITQGLNYLLAIACQSQHRSAAVMASQTLISIFFARHGDRDDEFRLFRFGPLGFERQLRRVLLPEIERILINIFIKGPYAHIQHEVELILQDEFHLDRLSPNTVFYFAVGLSDHEQAVGSYRYLQDRYPALREIIGIETLAQGIAYAQSEELARELLIDLLLDEYSPAILEAIAVHTPFKSIREASMRTLVNHPEVNLEQLKLILRASKRQKTLQCAQAALDVQPSTALQTLYEKLGAKPNNPLLEEESLSWIRSPNASLDMLP